MTTHVPFVLPKKNAGDQAGYIVACSTKLAKYPRKWKWDAISTYLRKLLVSFSAVVCFHGVCMIVPIHLSLHDANSIGYVFSS